LKIIVLAAGYATRLYPLTLNQPKPLLPVAGKPMIDHVLDRLCPAGKIDHIYVVTNAKFTPHFEAWAAQNQGTRGSAVIKVVNDGSTSEDNRLGAIGDLHYVLTQEKEDDDIMVIAGDNLFSQDLTDFGRACRERNAPILGIFDVQSLEAAKKYGVVDLDDNGVLKSFVEKPTNPATSLIGIALYYYPKSTLPQIRQYIQEGNNPDQPGRLIQWLCPRTPVFTWKVPGLWFDIGSKETLEEANQIFAKMGKS
jgi:glucose-1-phosphate thymidylyltransferase